MPRKHVVIYPSGSGVDFYRAERSYDSIWLRSGTASWITTLLPAVLSSVEQCDFTFSSFREIPLGDPSLMPLAPGSGYATKILCSCGGYYDAQWGSILFHSESHPPAIAGERFIPENGGIRKQVQDYFSQDFIDSMRKPDRPRVELWVRHSLEIETMLPSAYDAPRWLRETHGLSPEQAAGRLNYLRTACSPAEYEQKLKRDRQQREREAQAEEEAAFLQRQAEWLAEHQEAYEAEQAVRQYADSLSGTRTAEPQNAPPPEQPELSQRERTIAAKKLRSKIQRATKSKIQADAFNEKSAKAYSDKVVRRLEQEGKL
jgi:hypothetical protein